jgi:hypothetical protein
MLGDLIAQALADPDDMALAACCGRLSAARSSGPIRRCGSSACIACCTKSCGRRYRNPIGRRMSSGGTSCRSISPSRRGGSSVRLKSRDLILEKKEKAHGNCRCLHPALDDSSAL